MEIDSILVTDIKYERYNINSLPSNLNNYTNGYTGVAYAMALFYSYFVNSISYLSLFFLKILIYKGEDIMAEFKEIIPDEIWKMPLRFSELKEIEKTNKENIKFNIKGNNVQNIEINIVQGKYIGKMTIETVEGNMIAEDGDWIIRDINNNLYSAKSLHLNIHHTD